MKTSIVALLSLCATNVFALPESRRRADEKATELKDLLAEIKELQLTALEEEASDVKRRTNSKCNINNVAIRRE